MHIDEYFINDYINDSSENTDIKNIIEHILPTFLKTTKITIEKQFLLSEPKEPKSDFLSWPYKLTKSIDTQEYYSPSTASMILYALQKIIDISAFTGKKAQKNTLLSSLSDDDYKELIKLWESEFLVLLDRAKGEKLHSSTFGENNVFTLGWTIGVIDYYKKAALSEDFKKEIDKALETIRKEAYERINIYFDNPSENENIKSFFGKFDTTKETEKTFLEHAFHTLRAIHVFFKLTDLDIDDKVKAKVTEKIKTYFLSKIHDHLSYSEIANSNFDPSELVFALEGVLRIDAELNLKSIDYNLVNRIFKVIENSQNKNPYWRPLKPFVTTSQGMVLFPLSIEIANSLLRICQMVERQNKFYFSEYLELFKKYTDWLKSRQVVINLDRKQVYGWHSEHVNDSTIIHPWETAQVLHYLVKYSTMLQQHIARKSLKLSNLQSKLPEIIKVEDKKEYWNNRILKHDPVQYENKKLHSEEQIYYQIGRKYITPRISETNKKKLCSMLLYGPPGTGKSSIADVISAKLEWDLITITPSDFLSSGPSNVEAKAKSIFKCLMEQENKVVLFDEIDHLIMDRDSPMYTEQEDVFQFMTPSMLVKIKDLREKSNVIFIIATNYEDRIDKAIKRIGRIDESYLVLPPNKDARLEIIKRLFQDTTEEKNDINKGLREQQNKFPFDEVSLTKFLKKSCLYSFGELKLAFETAFDLCENSVEKIIFELERYKPEPSISLNAYLERFKTNREPKPESVVKVNQEPLVEFLRLLHLKIEVYEANKIIEDSKKVIKRVLNCILNEDDPKKGVDFYNIIKEKLEVKLLCNDDIVSDLSKFFSDKFDDISK